MERRTRAQAPPSRSAGARLEGEAPRERLRALGPGALSDAELLALVLRTGGAGRGGLDLSRLLLARAGGLLALARAAPAELRAPGVGPAKAASLEAAFELGRRIASRRLAPGDPITGPADVHRHLHPRLRGAPQEEFLALLLDGRHRLLREIPISRGTLTASLVHPREVFRPALREGAAALVLAHNHPSGDPTPSAEDREVTDRLVRAGELLGVRVVDHVVVAERGFASLRELGALPGPSGGPASGR